MAIFSFSRSNDLYSARLTFLEFGRNLFIFTVSLYKSQWLNAAKTFELLDLMHMIDVPHNVKGSRRK